MPRALVTGATGFVGSHLVDLLVEKGWSVAALLRPRSNPRWLEGKAVERISDGFSPESPLPPCDVLFNVAGLIRADSYPEYRAANRDHSVRVYESSRAGRFVHVSSLAAAGPGEAIDETSPCRPISLYGKSKWEGESEVWRRRARTPVTIVRPPVVYGPRDFGLRDMYWTVARGLRPEIGGPKRISIVHVRDLAEGIVKAALSEAGADQIFYLSNPDPVGISDVLDLMQRSLGVRALRVGIPDRVVRLLGAVAEDGARWAGLRSMFGRDKALEMTQKAWVCSPAKAQRLLGWRASIPLEEGMKETARWYLEHGYV